MKMKDFNPNRQNIDDPTDFFIATPDKSSPKTRKKKQTVDYQHSKKRPRNASSICSVVFRPSQKRQPRDNIGLDFFEPD